ncbi:uncharacterized [Tachysurus ichikawai]
MNLDSNMVLGWCDFFPPEFPDQRSRARSDRLGVTSRPNQSIEAKDIVVTSDQSGSGTPRPHTAVQKHTSDTIRSGVVIAMTYRIVGGDIGNAGGLETRKQVCVSAFGFVFGYFTMIPGPYADDTWVDLRSENTSCKFLMLLITYLVKKLGQIPSAPHPVFHTSATPFNEPSASTAGRIRPVCPQMCFQSSPRISSSLMYGKYTIGFKRSTVRHEHLRQRTTVEKSARLDEQVCPDSSSNAEQTLHHIHSEFFSPEMRNEEQWWSASRGNESDRVGYFSLIFWLMLCLHLGCLLKAKALPIRSTTLLAGARRKSRAVDPLPLHNHLVDFGVKSQRLIPRRREPTVAANGPHWLDEC